MAGAETDQQWPPRSPFEALLSSPSGRSRIRRYQDRTSPSPSPLKKARSNILLNQSQSRASEAAPVSEDEDEEDEETLQLRLQTLEAKLKLKRLQQKKKVKNTSTGSDVENERPTNSSACSESTTREEQAWKKPEQPVSQAGPRQAVQVPVSPQRKVATKDAPHSPGRVLLGIDKGLKGKNVSLRRAPETKSREALDDPFLEHASQCKRSTQRSNQPGSRLYEDQTRARPMTFSEKIADSRQRDKVQQEKSRKLQGQRSTGFGIGQEKLESLKSTAEEANAKAASSRQQSSANPAFSREEVLKAASRPNGGLLDRGITSSANQGLRRQKEFRNPNAPPDVTMPAKDFTTKRSSSPKPNEPKSSTTTKPAATDPSLFEPFSSLHLSKRLIPHDSLTQALSGKSILLLPNVLASVKAPDYSFPDDLSADIVILAIIASKSTPLAHKDQHKITPSSATASNPKTSHAEAAESAANERGKYMVLTLTDLKWTLDLYLFGSAFTRFRKLMPGTLVAVLNPSIMPPPPRNPHNNRFSLTLGANDDTVLELGTSRDLGWCASVRKDGRTCDAWIDKRHTSVCEFHVDLVVDKARRGRMELNGINTGFAPGGKKNPRSGFWGGGRHGGIKSQAFAAGALDTCASRRRPDGPRYHRGSQTTYHVGPGPSAASLLDTDADSLADRTGREERMRKRLAEREREREIARLLGEKGNGMGGEYLKIARHCHHQEGVPPVPPDEGGGGGVMEAVDAAAAKVDAASLGLKRGRALAEEVQLGPAVKGKRRKKTTRFLTEKGVKVAGRESLSVVDAVDGGGEGKGKEGAGGDDDDDDDDELDIV
ncbi:MAG: hypothetical protein Q9173_003440 [Seirophora scorigena]